MFTYPPLPFLIRVMKNMFECTVLEDYFWQPHLHVFNNSPFPFWLFIDARNVFGATWCKAPLSSSMLAFRWTFCSWNTPTPRPFYVCVVNLSICSCLFESNDIHFFMFNYYPPQVSFCKDEKIQFNVANYKTRNTINNSSLFPPFCLFTRVGRRRLVSCVARSPLWNSTLTSRWAS
jgi:hypothetical protein